VTFHIVYSIAYRISYEIELPTRKESGIKEEEDDCKLVENGEEVAEGRGGRIGKEIGVCVALIMSCACSINDLGAVGTSSDPKIHMKKKLN
jgi:hypothetical protein